jgi:SAM-dependent methyltransferase
MLSDAPDDLRQHQDWLLSLISLAEPATIVDLGCGSGQDLLALGGRYCHPNTRLIGIDASEKAIDRAAKRTAADSRMRLGHTRLGEKPPFDDSSLDVVYSKDLVECLPDRTAFVHDVARVLRPGGLAVIAHWDWDS